MGIVVKRTANEFVPHPEGGPFPAVLARVALHEGVETQWGVKDRIQLTWQTDQKMANHVDGIEDDRPMEISVFANMSLNKGSRLLELVTVQIPAKRLDDLLAETGGELDVEQALLGSQWLLQVEHVDREGRTFANVANAMKAPDGQSLDIWDRDSETWVPAAEPAEPKELPV